MNKPSLRSSLQLAVALSATALIASARPQSFDFKDPKGVNNIQFKLDAPLESITGTATGISGTVSYDAAAPEAVTGRIVLDTASLTVGNPVMGEHLRSGKWLDVDQYPTIVFEVVAVTKVRSLGTQIVGDVNGRLTVKGVTKDITVPVSFSLLADKLGARLGNDKLKGDLLVLRTNFEINRSEYDIMPGLATDKVDEVIHLSLSIAGAAPRA